MYRFQTRVSFTKSLTTSPRTKLMRFTTWHPIVTSMRVHFGVSRLRIGLTVGVLEEIARGAEAQREMDVRRSKLVRDHRVDTIKPTNAEELARGRNTRLVNSFRPCTIRIDKSHPSSLFWNILALPCTTSIVNQNQNLVWSVDSLPYEDNMVAKSLSIPTHYHQ